MWNGVGGWRGAVKITRAKSFGFPKAKAHGASFHRKITTLCGTLGMMIKNELRLWCVSYWKHLYYVWMERAWDSWVLSVLWCRARTFTPAGGLSGGPRSCIYLFKVSQNWVCRSRHGPTHCFIKSVLAGKLYPNEEDEYNINSLWSA